MPYPLLISDHRMSLDNSLWFLTGLSFITSTTIWSATSYLLFFKVFNFFAIMLLSHYHSTSTLFSYFIWYFILCLLLFTSVHLFLVGIDSVLPVLVSTPFVFCFFIRATIFIIFSSLTMTTSPKVQSLLYLFTF